MNRFRLGIVAVAAVLYGCASQPAAIQPQKLEEGLVLPTRTPFYTYYDPVELVPTMPPAEQENQKLQPNTVQSLETRVESYSIDYPFVSQVNPYQVMDHQCGPAVLASLEQYLGIRQIKSHEQVQAVRESMIEYSNTVTGKKNISEDSLIEWADMKGFFRHAYTMEMLELPRGDLETALDIVARERPVVATIDPSKLALPDGTIPEIFDYESQPNHYVVITGFDKETITVMDPLAFYVTGGRELVSYTLESFKEAYHEGFSPVY